MQGDEDPRDHAVDGVEDPFPADRSEGDRGHPGQKNQEPDEAAAAERLLQGDGEDVGADDHDHLGAEGEHDGIPERLFETGALQDAPEILEPDEMKPRAADARVAEGVEDRQSERNPDQEHDVENRGREHGGRQHRALSASDRFRLRAIHCHRSGRGRVRFCVSRSKNFSCLSETANACRLPISYLPTWLADMRETAFFPSERPPSRVP